MDGSSASTQRVIDVIGFDFVGRARPDAADRDEAEQDALKAADAAPVDPHRFADAMEAALTGVVVTGVLLFAAALLRYAAPYGAARVAGDDLLTLAAMVAGGASIFFVGRGILGGRIK